MRFPQQSGLLPRLSQREESLGELTRDLCWSPCIVEIPQSPQSWKEVGGLFDLLTQGIRSRVYLFHLWRVHPVRDHEDGAQSDVQIEIVVRTFGAARQRLHQR